METSLKKKTLASFISSNTLLSNVAGIESTAEKTKMNEGKRKTEDLWENML